VDKIYSRSFVFGEQTFDVVDVEKGRQQAILSFANAGSEDWLVDEPEMQPGGASTHGAVERRMAVQEIDRKTGACRERKQPRFAHSRRTPRAGLP
jgi:hypothetical protein